MHNQRGGSMMTSGYVALLLMALLCTACVKVVPKLPHPDQFVTHTFPEGRGTCDGFNTICWTRI